MGVNPAPNGAKGNALVQILLLMLMLMLVLVLMSLVLLIMYLLILVLLLQIVAFIAAFADARGCWTPKQRVSGCVRSSSKCNVGE